MIRRLFLAAVLAAFAAAAWAQSYPSRPVRLIVPFPPGGGFDGIARPFGEKLGAALGQTIVIDNRAGAAGNVGAEVAARSTADGYTLLFANDFLATNPPMLKSTSYDPLKDFVPITKVGTVATAMAVHPSVAASNLKELMALSRGKPLNFGTPGVGSVPHLVGEMLNLDGVLRLVHVPYKGSGPAITDTIGGQIEMVVTTLSSLAPHIRAGKLRGIGVIGPNRASFMPELPTFAEGGGPPINADIWYGLFAPAGTPEPVVRRLHEASMQALAQPDLLERLRKAGYEPTSSTPESLGTLLKTDLEKWRRVVSDAKIPRE
jgi:tripartite-type tricarboxylate transporter receptor subunit TctC